VKQALRRANTAKVTLTMNAVDAAGNAAKSKRNVTLKR
jgi:predicted transcriptional regulator